MPISPKVTTLAETIAAWWPAVEVKNEKSPYADLQEVAVMAFERISIDHKKMGGLPCIRDLRLPVSTVLGQLATGRGAGEILDDFPDLELADITAALEYAAAAAQERA